MRNRSILERLHGRWKKITRAMDPPVFFGAGGLVVAFVVFGGVFTDTAQRWFEAAQATISRRFGWFYALVVTGVLVFTVATGFSRHGKVRLGRDDDEPEFSRLSWFAMLFGAGMGTGLVFFGVAEPLTHWTTPPLAEDARSAAAAMDAMRLSFFHWGLHPWAIYVTLALAIGLFHFRYGLPLAPRSLLWPFLGSGIHGPIGKGVDVLCTVGTLVGVAASLGLGAMQINRGLQRLDLVPHERAVQLIIIAAITAMATTSVVLGIHRGIRRLSQVNLVLVSALWSFVLVFGPTTYVLDLFTTSVGRYLETLPFLSLWVADGDARAWQEEWTFAYWGWWLAWSPFVGVFVARVSKGRTIREFVFTVLFVPVVVSFLWMAVFGGTGLHEARDPEDGSKAMRFLDLAVDRPAVALHALLEQLPAGYWIGIVATVLTVIFFVTSSDSGSLVDDMVTSGGNPHPPRAQRVFWAVSEGAVAAALLVTDGLDALRTAAIVIGLPMAILVVVTCVSTRRALRRDRELAAGGAGAARGTPAGPS